MLALIGDHNVLICLVVEPLSRELAAMEAHVLGHSSLDEIFLLRSLRRSIVLGRMIKSYWFLDQSHVSNLSLKRVRRGYA